VEVTRGYFAYKGIMGHEFVGVVEDADYTDLVGQARCWGDKHKLRGVRHMPKREYPPLRAYQGHGDQRMAGLFR